MKITDSYYFNSSYFVHLLNIFTYSKFLNRQLMFIILPTNPFASFDQIANDLFIFNYIIQVNDNFYRLLEIEFYYNDSKDHNDSYTHGHKWQKKSGYGYVRGSGIDIAIGNEEAFGGILLQSIQKLSPEPTDKKDQNIY